MKKKIFLLALASLILLSAMAGAQQAKTVPRIGILASVHSSATDAFQQGLRDLGYVEGQNLIIERRYAEGKLNRLPDLAAELERLKVDVIVSVGLTTRYAAKSVKTIPVVMGYSGDPVEAGIVASLAQPGGNVTGMTFFAAELAGKRLEMLKEAIPGVMRVAVLANPGHPGEQRELRESQVTARSLAIALQYLAVRSANDLNEAFQAISREHAHALVTFPDALTMRYRKDIAEFSSKRRLPSVAGWAEFVEAGGLMSYGPNLLESYRRVALFVDKILKGAKPAEIPVEQPMRFEMVVNLKTAKQIGLTIPPNVLARADKVIK
jgi:putative ABC transport system substrate-binding protein